MTSDVQPLTLRTPYDVIGAVPHLLGFPPSESVVAICLADRRVLLTLRLDLPAPADEQQLAEEIAARAAWAGASEVLLVCFTEQVDPMATRARSALPRRRLVGLMGQALVGHGLAHGDALLVARGRWWSYLCSVPACCPPQGTPIAEPSATMVALQAEEVLRGAAVLSCREELAASIESARPPGDAPTGPVDAGPATDEDRRALVQLYDGWCAGTPNLIGAPRLVQALRDITFRDEVLAWTAQAEAASLLGMLTELCRLAADADAAPVCSVLAWAAYQQGSGALANVAADRALRAEPGYSLAVLLEQMIVGQVPPEELREVSRRLDPHPLLAAANDVEPARRQGA